MMNMKKIFFILPLLYLPAHSTYAEDNSSTWVDETHSDVKDTLDNWATSIDGWFGETDPEEPGSAVLRIILDNNWNRYDGYSIKPRIRGKLRLPTLKRKFSLVFGDDELDNEVSRNHHNKNYKKSLKKNKVYDSKQSQDDNKSLALRWADSIKSVGINLKLDLGIRSGNDLYLRVKGDKDWQLSEQLVSSLETVYRWGTKSKHYAQISWENKYHETEYRAFANQVYLNYTNDLTSENISWGDTIYREHYYSNHKRLNYGVFFGGKLDSKKFSMNSYGPFINWRQPIWKKWIFIEPELNFYNDRELDRKHNVGAFLRLEAIF